MTHPEYERGNESELTSDTREASVGETKYVQEAADEG